MKATFLVIACSLVLCFGTAHAQSATQSITIVILPVNTMSSSTQLVSMAALDGGEGMDGQATYSLVSSEPAKITAQMGPGSVSDGLWATTGFFPEPTILTGEASDLANGLPATLGASLHIWYGADTQLSERAGDTLRDKAAVVVLTFTN